MTKIEEQRHSTAHILAAAVLKLWPKTKLGIGPTIEDGFYYDFDLDHKLAPEDFPKIEREMKELIKKNDKFERIETSASEAKKQFKNDPYKLELIKDLENQKITFYKTGDFIDLCKGPHVKFTKQVGKFKLLKVSGSYWKGNANNKPMQRIYGTSFPTQEELDQYLFKIEEAKKRDHRKLGKELDLFSFHEEAPGMVFLHPKGMTMWNELTNYWYGEHIKSGYEFLKTPIILNKKLWLQSGHWDHYKENMYFTKIDNEDFAVKPMNCPGSILIYKTKLHSYKDLPLRWGEIGLVHRHELSGVLSGILRVRSFHQDDAHIYCTEEQIEQEVSSMIRLFDKVYKQFNLSYHIELSTKPKNSMGTKEMWNKAEKFLENAIKKQKLNFKINPGDGAFYGPKIDFHIKDAIGRTWQCGTIQLDFQMPEKFNLTYEGPDGKKHRPTMLHRVVYGSLERFLGILVEHYAGKFPVWLSPVQVVLMTITDKHSDYAKKLKQELETNNIRVELDDRQESMGKKVRDNQSMKISYMITLGDKELETNNLAIRTRDNQVINLKKEAFIDRVLKEIKERK